MTHRKIKFLLKNFIDALDNKLAEGVYNIKGGIFALNAITIKAQKNPENQNYAITYAFVDNTEVVALREEDDGTGNWKPVPGTYILMDAPADGSDYYTYTFLSAKQIMNLRLAMIDENNNPYTEVYYNYDELTPGPVCRTTDEIIDYIRCIDERFDPRQVAAFRSLFMGSCDGHATERIEELVFGHSLR